MAHPFERDLGYLDRFLEKAKAHAEELADPGQGQRLAALLDEEVARWRELRALMAGEIGAKAEEEAGGADAASPAAEPTAPSTIGDTAHAAAGEPAPREAPAVVGSEAGEGTTPVGGRRAGSVAGSGETQEAQQGRRWTVGPLRPSS